MPLVERISHNSAFVPGRAAAVLDGHLRQLPQRPRSPVSLKPLAGRARRAPQLQPTAPLAHAPPVVTSVMWCLLYPEVAAVFTVPGDAGSEIRACTPAGGNSDAVPYVSGNLLKR